MESAHIFSMSVLLCTNGMNHIATGKTTATSVNGFADIKCFVSFYYSIGLFLSKEMSHFAYQLPRHRPFPTVVSNNR